MAGTRTTAQAKVGIQPTDVVTAMDVTGSWGVTFLVSSIGGKRRLPHKAMRQACYVPGHSTEQRLDMATSLDPFTVATEFTAQAAAAGIKDADFVMQQLYPLQLSEGLPCWRILWRNRSLVWRSLPLWNTTMYGVSPTAWVYFASSGIGSLLNIPHRPNVCILYLPVITR
ncbi:MAG: hypothetical protein R2867_20235 [Caldilineaceae bacterium]